MLEGVTASADHETALRHIAQQHFDKAVAQTELRPGVILTDNWDTASVRLLYALASLESAQAVMRSRSIEIRGVTSDIDTFTARLQFLREILLSDTAVATDVIVVGSTASLDLLCEQAFSQLVLDPVSFKQSSTEIRSMSYAILDRITDFAHDCQRTTITIIGHTDASGNESWNSRLSQARAQAVADHISDNGIDPVRLIVKGLGSSQPIADNTTVHGRGRNRRIEFKLQ